MDLINKALQELRAEKAKLEQVIALLLEMQRSFETRYSPITGKRRGRKSMGAKEREEVSARMKRYWAGRRKRQGGPAAGSEAR